MYEGILDLRLRRAPTDCKSASPDSDRQGSVPSSPDEIIDWSLLLRRFAALWLRRVGRPVAEVERRRRTAVEKVEVHSHAIPEGLPRRSRASRGSFAQPGAVRPGGLYVDFGNRRHDQGAVYTPTSITEPMIRERLKRLVSSGR